MPPLGRSVWPLIQPPSGPARNEALAAAGADVTYRELDDLSHCYPREMNAPILDWLRGEK